MLKTLFPGSYLFHEGGTERSLRTRLSRRTNRKFEEVGNKRDDGGGGGVEESQKKEKNENYHVTLPELEPGPENE